MPTKLCSKCHLDLNFSCFNKSKTGKFGLRGDCRICQSLLNKKYKSTEKSNNTKQWKLLNKELVSSYGKEYYKKNIVYYQNYRELNKENHNIYIKDRLSTDTLFKLSINIRNLIRLSFNRNNYTKKSKTEQILGCSYKEFKQHLELQFQSWMNWDNRGLYNGELNFGWDIDHIIPLSSAKSEEEIIKLNHYSNLQPLCSKINRYVKKNYYANIL